MSISQGLIQALSSDSSKTICQICKKILSFSSILCHQKTVHKQDVGIVWKCEACQMNCQSKKRLAHHEQKHQEDPSNSTNNQFHCDECLYRTILKAYLGDHVRMMHTKEGCGMWMCAFGKCASRPVTFPNQKRLDKHKTCHSNEKCVLCEKNFNAKRNMLKHKKTVHDKRSAGDVEQEVGEDPLNEAM